MILLSQQLQMDKIPSRHAITEVMSWISLMENVIQQDEENIKNVVGQKAIQEYVQKYKVLSGNIINFPFELSPLLLQLNIYTFVRYKWFREKKMHQLCGVVGIVHKLELGNIWYCGKEAKTTFTLLFIYSRNIIFNMLTLISRRIQSNMHIIKPY